jgi:hypothetical protein
MAANIPFDGSLATAATSAELQFVSRRLQSNFDSGGNGNGSWGDGEGDGDGEPGQVRRRWRSCGGARVRAGEREGE